MSESLFAHFGLTGTPFPPAESDTFFYEAPAHRDALGALRASLRRAPSVSLLVGPPGVGKTKLLRQFAETVGSAARFGWLERDPDSTSSLVVRVKSQKDAESKALGAWKDEALTANDCTVLIIDDAATLIAAQWATLAALIKDDRFTSSRCSLMIAGPPALKEQATSAPAQAAIAHCDRIAALEEFTYAQTKHYLAQRFRLVGGDVKQIFSDDALLGLHLAARGIPGAIPRFAIRALEHAAEAERQQVFAADIIAARRELVSPRPVVAVAPTRRFESKTASSEPVVSFRDDDPSVDRKETVPPERAAEFARLSQLESRLSDALQNVRRAKEELLRESHSPSTDAESTIASTPDRNADEVASSLIAQ